MEAAITSYFIPNCAGVFTELGREISILGTTTSWSLASALQAHLISPTGNRASWTICIWTLASLPILEFTRSLHNQTAEYWRQDLNATSLLCHHRPPEKKMGRKAMTKTAAINWRFPPKKPPTHLLLFSPSPPTGQNSFTSQELSTLVKCQVNRRKIKVVVIFFIF